MALDIFSTDEIESVTAETIDLPHERHRASILAQRPAAPSSDGIKTFMTNFAVSTALAETVAPATQNFLKAASFLFRK